SCYRDWSSDVCSSDLAGPSSPRKQPQLLRRRSPRNPPRITLLSCPTRASPSTPVDRPRDPETTERPDGGEDDVAREVAALARMRSEERRVGKACGSGA